MRMIALLLSVTGLGLLTPCAAAAQDAPTARVTRDGDAWSADIVLQADAPVWAFSQSALSREERQSWRVGYWRIETPGVTLTRVGRWDVLSAADGAAVPRHVRIAFAPRSIDLEAAYDPALVFTTGAVALSSDQFDLAAAPDLAALDGLDVEGVDGTSVTWSDTAGPVLFRGDRRTDPTATDARTYVLFGQGELVETPGLAALIDPGLPSWAGDALRSFTPEVIAWYAQYLGQGPKDRPTILASWDGPTPGKTSMGGSVLPGLITMTFEGQGVVAPSDRVLGMARWFVGHESAHFWLGQTVEYETSQDAWITEGGADFLAIRSAKAIDPAYDARAVFQQSVDDCVTLADDPVKTAEDRGEHRAYYACGAVFMLAAEGLNHGDGAGFIRDLIDARRAAGTIRREDWLAALAGLEGGREARKRIEVLLDNGVSDPAAAIADLLTGAGVSVRTEAGTVILS